MTRGVSALKRKLPETRKVPEGVGINHDQRLYTIPCERGYTCLGFDVAERRRAGTMAWLGLPLVPVKLGTLDHYDAYLDAMQHARRHHERTRQVCPIELTPQLIGKEGWRVEVSYTDSDGYVEKNRFIVGKSTGWMPYHLEIARVNSHGGGSVYVPEGARVTVIDTDPHATYRKRKRR